MSAHEPDVVAAALVPVVGVGDHRGGHLVRWGVTLGLRFVLAVLDVQHAAERLNADQHGQTTRISSTRPSSST